MRNKPPSMQATIVTAEKQSARVADHMAVYHQCKGISDQFHRRSVLRIQQILYWRFLAKANFVDFDEIGMLNTFSWEIKD